MEMHSNEYLTVKFVSSLFAIVSSSTAICLPFSICVLTSEYFCTMHFDSYSLVQQCEGF